MRIIFQAALEKLEDAELGWIVVRVPFDPKKAWPTRSKLRVQGTLRAATARPSDAIQINTSLSGNQASGYRMIVTRKMQKAAHLSIGSLAEIALEPDLEGRAAMPPPALAKLLNADRDLKRWFAQLSYSIRKYIADNITEAAAPQVRKRRAEQWAERLLLTIEGEQHPPPILQIAFQHQPQARLGWQAMTPIQRRNTLLSIYSCQSVEARSKRTERAIADAIAVAKKLALNKPAI